MQNLSAQEGSPEGEMLRERQKSRRKGTRAKATQRRGQDNKRLSIVSVAHSQSASQSEFDIEHTTLRANEQKDER